MAAEAVTTSGDVGLHKRKCANHEVGLPPYTIRFRDRILYLFSSYHPTLLTMSGKSPSDRGRWDISPTVAIPTVATATSLSSRMGPLITQYDND